MLVCISIPFLSLREAHSLCHVLLERGRLSRRSRGYTLTTVPRSRCSASDESKLCKMMSQGLRPSPTRSAVKYTPTETTQIYQQWCNHYLEKVKSKRRIHDLPNDVTDGVVLADVIEAVTNQKLPDVNRKPKTASQMIDNIATCLRLLTALNIPLEEITAADIHSGNLKSILTVFFALSRYKQQQKLQQQQEMAKIPVAKATNIPVVGAGKKPQMISKIAVPSSVHYGSPQLRPVSSTATSAASSRSASPSRGSTGSGNLVSSTSSLIPRTPTRTAASTTKVNSIKTPIAAHPLNKQSMLEKFKLFKPNEKPLGVPTATLPKRPSSSSGFSSGRSEQSDVSFPSGSNNNTPVTPPLTTLAVFDQPPARKTIPNGHQVIQNNGTKERSIRTARSSKNSPKLSPKVKRVPDTEETGSKMPEQLLSSAAQPSAKPLSAGSGIPKPTAAVKGTAKVIPKPTPALEGSAALQRTPGDGKEVTLGASPQTTCSSAEEALPCKASESSSTAQFETHPPTTQVTLNGNPDGNRLPQLGNSTSESNSQSTMVEVESREEAESSQHPENVEIVGCRSQVAKVLPMSSDPATVEEEEEVPMNVQPMTPLFNMGLVKRHDRQPTTSSPTTAVKRAANGSYTDPLDGYMSEGCASLYARKLHHLAVTQRNNKDDDSFDDSSSLSSGISDPWNEIYGLHLKMEQGSVYPGIPNGYGTPLQNRRHPPSSSLSDSSPYKQISSSQWKKFIEAGRLPSSSERFQLELWKGEPRERSRSQQSDPSSPKKAEHKKLNTTEPGKRVKVYTESDALGGGRPVKGVPASFGYVKKSSDMKRHAEAAAANGKSPMYKTANVTSVPKLMDGQTVSLNRSLERPKTKLKVSGGTQTDMGETSRSIKPSQYKTSSLFSSSTCSSPVPTSHQLNGSYSDSEYQTSNGIKFESVPGSVASTITSSSAAASNANKSNYQQPTFKSYSLTAPIANQLSQNVRERLLLNNGTQSLPKGHLNLLKGLEEKRQAHANFAAHLFAGVSELNGETDLNLDSSGTSNGNNDKLRDKEKSIKYVVNGRNMHTDGSLSDTPYTAYWNKYHPKNASDLVSDPESLDSVPMHGPKIPSWINNPPSSPRLNRSNSVRSTKSEKVYPSMMQRNEEGELNNFTSHLMENGGDGNAAHRYAASSTGVHSVSRSSLGNYSALLSLSRMGSKEEDCHGSSLSLVSTASSLYSSQEEKQASEIRKLRRELNEAHEKVNTLSGQLSTNAHVVAAFEQSLASMTSRLQSLTMTAERKENELQELRQIMDQMRKQGVQIGSSPSRPEAQETPSSTMTRQLSSDSVSSLVSQATNASSVSSPPQPLPPCSPSPSLKKKSWLRNSFSKAFSRSKRPPDSLRQSAGSDSEDSSGPSGGGGGVSTWSAPSSPMLGSHHHRHLHSALQSDDLADQMGASSAASASPETLQELKKQLREKDMVLTDIRLEALSSAHQLEALKETVSRMRNEMLTLKQDNERLQRQLEHQQSASSSPYQTVDRGSSNQQNRSSTGDSSVITEFMLGLDSDKESKFIEVFLQIDDHAMSENENGPSSWMIGYVAVSGKTRWEMLDRNIGKLFTDYVRQVDPTSHLGLDDECLWYYRVGEVMRSLAGDESSAGSTPPELLPFGYLVGDCNQIQVAVKTTAKYALPACLTLETLIPLPILNRYVSLLSEHRRVIVCGPSGTGKSYLARKLAEYCIGKDGKCTTAAAPLISSFKIDATSCKEVRQFLSHVTDCLMAGNLSDVPSVIILEDLHLATSLNDVFSPLARLESSQDNLRFPYVIGTTGPMTQSSAQLQLQFNFRWILLANHMEPVQGLLQRFLRRRLIQSELKSKASDQELERIFEWIPRCLAHLNKFLETHNSADVTIGPRWFLQVPVDSICSQVWFTDLWNYTLGPYLMHAAKEGLQLYGKRAAWEDPVLWVMSTYPWAQGSAYDALMRLRPEDVGYDTATRPKSLSSAADQDRDPLFNMLIKLQEAANLPSPTENSENGSESQASSVVSTKDD